MLSSSELLSILSGRSSILDPPQIKKQLSSAKERLLKGLDHYQLPSTGSEEKLKNDKTVKRLDFILKLSKLLNLDELQSHQLFQSYLRTDFRGSSSQLLSILRHDMQTEEFILKVVDYYHKERSSLLTCIKHIFGYWQNGECLFRDQFAEVVEELVGQGFIDKVLSQYKSVCSKAANHNGKISNKDVQTQFARQYIKEQADLLEIMLLYYKEFDMTAERILILAKIFQGQSFGLKQQNKMFLDASLNQTVERIGYLQSLILMSAVDLEMLKMIQLGERSSHDHHLLATAEKTEELDELYNSWGDSQAHGPPLLGWVVFRFIALEGEQEEVTRRLGQVALKCNVFQYLLGMLKDCFFSAPLPAGHLCKKLVYSLLDLVLSLFHEDTLGDFQVLLSLAQETLSEPISAIEFWASDTQSGLHMLLKSTRNRFPYLMCPLIDLLVCLCKDEQTARQVYHYLHNLKSFTELFGKNRVDEISATQDITVWKRNVDHFVIGHDDQKLIIPAGSFGRLFQVADETRLIRWNYSYSGWLFLALELQQFLLHPYEEGDGEPQIQRITSLIELVTVVIQHDWSKSVTLDLLIGGAISILDRFAALTSPPLLLLSACIKCLQVVVQRKPDKIWTHLLQIGFLPRSERSMVSESSESSQNLVMGHLGSILMGVECVSGCYPVTKEYLKFFLEFIQVVHDNKDEYEEFFRSIYDDYMANVVLIARDMLGGFSQWRFTVAGEKESVAKELLQIANIILAQSQSAETSASLSDFKADMVVLQGFLFHESGEMLLNIVSIGVDTVLRSTSGASRGSTSEVTQVVKLAFSLLIKLLTCSSKVRELSSLEEALCVQYVSQERSLDHLHDKATLISVLANYIYYQHDAKLPTLAVMVLQRLCMISPISMAAALEPDAAGIRNAFITRLQQGIEPPRLKIAILEFVATAAEHQPGLMELFVQLGPAKKGDDKTKGLTFGKFSCLGPILDILDPKINNNQPLLLLIAALKALESFWMNRRDSVLNVLRHREHFWNNLLCHLKMIFQDEIAKEEDQCVACILKIVALEMYYARQDDFDKELTKEMKKQITLDFYKKLTKRLYHSTAHSSKKSLPGLLALMNGLKMFLFTGSHLHGEKCSLTIGTQEIIFTEIVNALKSWILSKESNMKRIIETELADMIMVLAKRWGRTIKNANPPLAVAVEILEETLSIDAQLIKLQTSLLCTVLHLLQGNVEQRVKGQQIKKDTIMSLLPTICRTINFHDFSSETETKRRQERIKLAVMSISVLNKLSKMIHSSGALAELLREHSTFSTLHYMVEYCLKNIKDLKMALSGMLLLQTFSEYPELAGAMVTNGIAKLLSLQLNTTYALAEEPSHVNESSDLYEIWCSGISIASNLLKSLNHGFLQSALDFIGAHKERLSQAMSIMRRVHSQQLLTETEEVSKFLFQLTRYPRDWHFSLPTLMPSFQREIVDLTETTVALLSRPRLLSHLVEAEREDNVESVLERARTPSPLAFDSSRSLCKDDTLEGVNPLTESVQDKLLSLLCNCIGCMLHLTPDVREAVMDECFDFDGFTPLIELAFNSPSLNSESHPSFGLLLSCLNIALKLLYKVPGDDVTKSPSSASEVSEASERRRSLLTYLMETTMIVVISQATCYLRHPDVDGRSKQFLKRELGSELSNYLHALHRHMTRRGIPPSPISGDKLSASGSSVYKRSPSKLGPLFADSDDMTVYKLADIYTKQLLR